MRKVLIISLTTILLLFIVSCKKESYSGTVYEKEFRKSYSEIIILPMYLYNGKTTTILFMPVRRIYPDRYVIKIEWFDEKADELKKKEVFVKKEVYEEIEVGDFFEYDKKKVYDKEPYTQEKEEEKWLK